MDRASTRALSKIKRHRPATIAAFRGLFDLQKIGYGVFRQAHRIKGTKLVVKLPRSLSLASLGESVIHSRDEIKRIEKLKTLPELRPHLPRIYYYDLNNGVIVMQEYKIDNIENSKLLGRVIQKLIKRLIGVNCSDIHSGNIGKRVVVRGNRSKRVIVFLDLGY